MGYCTACDVYALVKNLILPSGSFDLNTCPTLNDINLFISSGSSVIDSELAGQGYLPIAVANTPYGLATQINANFAAWLAESSRLSAMVQAGERTRADVFLKNWQLLLKLLTDMDLSRAGVADFGSKAYAGGISVSDKKAVQSNADRVKNRFFRDMNKNPMRSDPAQFMPTGS